MRLAEPAREHPEHSHLHRVLVQEYKEAMGEGLRWLAGLQEVRNVTWVDLPTSHWPMWSRPRELAEIIGSVAKASGQDR